MRVARKKKENSQEKNDLHDHDYVNVQKKRKGVVDVKCEGGRGK